MGGVRGPSSRCRRSWRGGGPASGGRTGREVQIGLYAPAPTPEGSLRGVVAVELARRRMANCFAEATARRAVSIRPTGWLLLTGAPSAMAISAARRDVAILGGLGLGIAVLGVAGARLLGRRAGAGLERLRRAMTRVKAGDLPAALPRTVGGKVSARTESFNRMLTRLRRRLRDYATLSQVEEVAAQAAVPSGAARSADRTHGSLLRRIVGGLRGDVGVLVLVENGDLVTRALGGFPGRAGRRSSPPTTPQSLAGAVASERAPVVVRDVGADHRVAEPCLRESGICAAGRGANGVGRRGGGRARSGLPGSARVRGRRGGPSRRDGQAPDPGHRAGSGGGVRPAEHAGARGPGGSAARGALQRAASERAEVDRLAAEARRGAQKLERKIQHQAAEPPAVRETVREVVKRLFEPFLPVAPRGRCALPGDGAVRDRLSPSGRGPRRKAPRAPPRASGRQGVSRQAGRRGADAALAPLVAIVDLYDALRTERPYKRAVRETDSLRMRHEGARSGQFDPELACVFLEIRGGARPAS